MFFMVQCFDKPDSLDLRLKTRGAHLNYAQKLGSKLLFAGPMMDGEGDMMTPIGSLIMIDMDDIIAAKSFAASDPYALAGLFERVEVRPWVAAIGSWKPASV